MEVINNNSIFSPEIYENSCTKINRLPQFEDILNSKPHEQQLIVRTSLKVPYSPKKISENEVATFLNKGQKYVLEQKCTSPQIAMGLPLKTIIKLEFFDSDHSQKEVAHFIEWRRDHKSDNFIEISSNENDNKTIIKQMDLYGTLWELEWISNTISCVNFSPKFAGSDFKKRQGCEGAIMSLKCETVCVCEEINKNENQSPYMSYITCCRLKVFKFKGADRKLKQDIEKFVEKDNYVKNEIKKFSESYRKIEECQNTLKRLEEQERLAILDVYISQEEDLNDTLKSASESFTTNKAEFKYEKEIIKNMLDAEKKEKQLQLTFQESEFLDEIEMKTKEFEKSAEFENLNFSLSKDKLITSYVQNKIEKLNAIYEEQNNIQAEISKEKIVQTLGFNISKVEEEEKMKAELNRLDVFCEKELEEIEIKKFNESIEYDKKLNELKNISLEHASELESVKINKLIEIEHIKNEELRIKNDIEYQKTQAHRQILIDTDFLNMKKQCIELEKNTNMKKIDVAKKDVDIETEEILGKLDQNTEILEIENMKVNMMIEEEKKYNDQKCMEEKSETKSLKNIAVKKLDEKIIHAKNEKDLKCLQAELDESLKIKQSEINKNQLSIMAECEKQAQLKDIENNIFSIKSQNLIHQKKYEAEKTIIKQMALKEQTSTETEKLILQQKANQEKLISDQKSEQEKVAAESEKLIKFQKAEHEKLICSQKSEEEKVAAESEKLIKYQKAEHEKLISFKKSEEEKVAAESEKLIKYHAAESLRLLKQQKAEEEKISGETDALIKQKISEEKLFSDEINLENTIYQKKLDSIFKLNICNMKKQSLENETGFFINKAESDQIIAKSLAENEKNNKLYDASTINTILVKKINDQKSLIEHEFNFKDTSIENLKRYKNSLADRKLLDHEFQKSLQSKKIEQEKFKVEVLKEEINDQLVKKEWKLKNDAFNNIFQCDKELSQRELMTIDSLNQLNEQEIKHGLETSEKVSKVDTEFQTIQDKINYDINMIPHLFNQTNRNHNLKNFDFIKMESDISLLKSGTQMKIEAEHTLKKNNIDQSIKNFETYCSNIKEKIDKHYEIEINSVDCNNQIDMLNIETQYGISQFESKKRKTKTKQEIECEKNKILQTLNEKKLVQHQIFRELEEENEKYYQNIGKNNIKSFVNTFDEIHKLKDKNIDSAIKKNNHLEEKHRKIYKEFQSKLEKQKRDTLKRLDILNREAEKRKSSLSLCMKQFGDNFSFLSNETVLHEPKNHHDKQSFAPIYLSSPPSYESLSNDFTSSDDSFSSFSFSKRSFPPSYSPEKISMPTDFSRNDKAFIQELIKMDHNELNEWLKSNRFEDASIILKNFNGSELVKLKKDELIELMGVADAIRFRNLLETRETNENKTIYITLLNGNGEIVKDSKKSCVLEKSSVSALIDTASKCIDFPKEIVEYAYTLNICGQKIILNDQIVSSFPNFSSFILRIEKDNYYDEKMKLGFIPNNNTPLNT